MAFLAVTLATGGLVVPTASATSMDEMDAHPFPRVGTFTWDVPHYGAFGDGTFADSMWVDPIERRLFGANEFGDVSVVDLNANPPEQIDFIEVGLRQVDDRRWDKPMLYVPELGTLLYGRVNAPAGTDSLACVATQTPCVTDRGMLRVVDVAKPGGDVFAPRNLGQVSGRSLQGGIRGLAYDAEAHILYVLESPPATIGNISISPPTSAGGVAVHAFRNSSPDPRTFSNLTHLWVRRATGCVLPKGGGSEGWSFGVTGDGVPYFLCVPLEKAPPPANSAEILQSLPHFKVGEAGVARLFVEDVNDRLGITKARVDFNPLPGNISQSKSFVDHVNDRLVVTISGSGRAQAFVFDALRGTWIGAAVLSQGKHNYIQADPFTKRVYILEDGGDDHEVCPPGTVSATCNNIRIVDTASVPIDVQATVYRHPRVSQAVNAFDPISRRLFVQTATSPPVVSIYQDVTPPLVPASQEALDPDRHTNDVDEDEATSVDRIGGASAYGARMHLGGGVRGGLQEFFLDHDAWENDEGGVLAPRRPAKGHRGLLAGHIEELDFRGGRDHGESEARAVGVAFQEKDPTEDELRTTYDEVTGQAVAPFVGEAPDAAGCDPDTPDHDCLAYDALADRVGERFMATCRVRGQDEDRPTGREDGAAVACSDAGAEASAASSEAMGNLPVRIGYAASRASSRYDPERGVVTTVESFARGVEVDVPGLGSLRIGEIRQRAETWANGRPGGAGSEPVWSANGVRITDAAGDTVWACGTEGPDDSAGRCDSVALAEAINRTFQTSVYARGPRIDEDQTVVGSPGGARAIVRKDKFAVENDKAVHGDERLEVAGLELMIVNDSEEVSRLVVQLAGVYGESQYRIGPRAAQVEPQGPASLVIELLDDLGDPLAGGMFEVRAVGDLLDPPSTGADPSVEPDDEGGQNLDAEDDAEDDAKGESQAASLGDDLDGILGLDGSLVDGGVCITGDDGIGECRFEDLEPGTYRITQTAAPQGYFRADALDVPVFPGFVTEIMFMNPRAIGGIEISLTDDSDPPAPLEGGEFALLAEGSVELARCRTAADGTCGFADVPLAGYVVRQTAAPGEYLPVDDIAFSLDLPGQVAVLRIVNGLEGIAAASTPAFTPPAVDQVTFRPGPGAPQPIVRHTPAAPPSQPSGLGRVLSVPGDVLGFLARRPGEALLIAGVWLLFATPAYLAARRRSLIIAKGVA